MVYVKYLNEEVAKRCPFRPAKPGDCGVDLAYCGEEEVCLSPGDSKKLPVGISVKIPDNWAGFIKPRSSTFGVKGLCVVECVIDSGYTGPLFVVTYRPMLNNSLHGVDETGKVVIRPWDRLAQLVIVPAMCRHDVCVTNTLPETNRGDSGFGSTGA